MNFILGPLRVVYKIWFFTYFVVSLLVMYPYFYLTLTKRKWFKYTFAGMRFWSFILRIGNGIYLDVQGKENIPKNAPFIICPNHSSYLDIILMYGVFSRYFVFMGKQEISKFPLFHIFFTRNEMNVLVNRGSRVGSHKAYLKISREIDQGNNVVIFPEGTIPNDAPLLKRFKNGAFKLAIEKQIPVVPVTFTYNWKLLQGSKFFKGFAGIGRTHCVIHKPIATLGMEQHDLVGLREETYETIETCLKTYLNEDYK